MLKSLKMNIWDDCSDVFAPHIGTNKFHAKKKKILSYRKEIGVFGWSENMAFSLYIIQNFQPMIHSVIKSYTNHRYFLNRAKEMDYLEE
jgi:hypothetical protein